MKKASTWSWVVAGVLTAATAGFWAFLPGIVLNNNVNIYFPHSHPLYVREQAVDDTYGSQMFLVVAITDLEGSIVSAKAVDRVRGLTAQFEKFPGVGNGKSMTNIDWVTGQKDGLASETLVPKDFTGSAADLAKLSERIADWSTLYKRVVLSDDGSGTQIIVTVDHTEPGLRAPGLPSRGPNRRGVHERLLG
jgi:predicted RND superfamily exporter protein